jgi:hypothetical protein
MRHQQLIDDLTRRDFVARAAAGGLAAVLLGALPLARELAAAGPAFAADPLTDGTLQAFADTMIPGRKATTTDLGNTINPQAIAGVDDRPGAVEADALAVYRNPKLGFETLAPPFLADLESRALPAGGPFLTLDWDRRVRVCIAGLAFDNPTRTLWEAAAAVPFAAFCGAGMAPAQTAAKSSGYRVMGHPGAAPGGYWDASFRRKLSRERTKTGSLP